MSRIHPQSLVPTERLELIEDPAPVAQAAIENIAIALSLLPWKDFLNPSYPEQFYLDHLKISLVESL